MATRVGVESTIAIDTCMHGYDDPYEKSVAAYLEPVGSCCRLRDHVIAARSEQQNSKQDGSRRTVCSGMHCACFPARMVLATCCCTSHSQGTPHLHRGARAAKFRERYSPRIDARGNGRAQGIFPVRGAQCESLAFITTAHRVIGSVRMLLHRAPS